MLKELIEKLICGQHLTRDDTAQAVIEMVNDPNPQQIAAFLVLLRAKGETVEEILGVVITLQALMVPVNVNYPVLDIVGTGGDAADSINISTGSCIVAAACGLKVAKHGNRSASGKCGSADVLETLGVVISMPANDIVRLIDTIGIAFIYARDYHPCLKKIADIRRGLSVRTLFNIIGPLVNPARAAFRMIGVYSPQLLDVIAEVMYRLGTDHTLVFHGSGLDELSCAGPVEVREVTREGISSWILDPETLGLPRCSVEQLQGSDAAGNAALLTRVLQGEKGPVADTLALNAGVALWLCGKTSTIAEGISAAQRCLNRGDALNLLNQWVALCQTFSTKS